MDGRSLLQGSSKKRRTRVAYGLSGGVALLAWVALWFGNDREAAAILAFMACWSFWFACLTAHAGLKNTESSREMHRK